MTERLHRDFIAPWQSGAIQEVFQSLLMAELVSPSPEFWLLSGWITDIELVDNSARAFSGVRPDWPATGIELSKVLEAIAERGAKVAVIVREVDHNIAFVNRLHAAQRRLPGQLGVVVAPNAHEKAIIGTDYVFGGSMNITRNGLNASDEHVLLRVDREAAAARRLGLHERWGKELSWR